MALIKIVLNDQVIGTLNYNNVISKQLSKLKENKYQFVYIYKIDFKANLEVNCYDFTCLLRPL